MRVFTANENVIPLPCHVLSVVFAYTKKVDVTVRCCGCYLSITLFIHWCHYCVALLLWTACALPLPHISLLHRTLAYVPSICHALQSCVAAGGITCAIMSGTLSITTLPSLGMQLSNTFSLFCVLVLLGYGLVAVPRAVWRRSFAELQLRQQLFRYVSYQLPTVQSLSRSQCAVSSADISAAARTGVQSGKHVMLLLPVCKLGRVLDHKRDSPLR